MPAVTINQTSGDRPCIDGNVQRTSLVVQNTAEMPFRLRFFGPVSLSDGLVLRPGAKMTLNGPVASQPVWAACADLRNLEYEAAIAETTTAVPVVPSNGTGTGNQASNDPQPLLFSPTAAAMAALNLINLVGSSDDTEF